MVPMDETQVMGGSCCGDPCE